MSLDINYGKFKTRKFPTHLIIELTNKCNFNCKYCPARKMNIREGFMEPRLFFNIIKQCRKKVSIDLFRRGESLLHPDFLRLVKYAYPRTRELNLATNASLLTKELSEHLVDYLSFIHFSIDIKKHFGNRNKEMYKQVIKNIKDFLKMNKGKVRTQVSLVKTNHTKKELEKFKKYWIKKVDRVRIYEQHTIKGISGKLKKKREERQPCTKPFYEMLIYWDGTVGRCNHDWNGNIGNVNYQKIKDIWNSGFYKSLRNQHYFLNISDPVCKNCDSWYEEKKESSIGELEVKK